jgi:MinD superfamily P-loop ATPase
MKQITLISGKGGTGKTVISGCFAALAENKIMADCDVDAADLHLLLHPQIKERHEFKAGSKAVLNQEECILCGMCIQVCRFSAIRETEDRIVIDPVACEGCGVCALNCSVEAIKMEENMSGEWYISDTRYGPLVHAKLGIAEENTGKLVTLVRENALTMAQKNGLNLIVVDGPPGIGCPVIASIAGVDLVVVVTEPTLSAIADLDRVLSLTRHFGIETVILINKFDINYENTEKIESFCQKKNIEILSKIPFDNSFTRAMVQGKTIIEYDSSGATQEIKKVWEKIEQRLKKKKD